MDGESRSPLFYRHVAAGAAAAVVASAVTYPLDVAKAVAQAGVAHAGVAQAVVAQAGAVQGSGMTVGGGPGGMAGSGTAASRAAATSGLSWRNKASFIGFSPHLAGHLPSLAARYTTYHLAAAYQMDGLPPWLPISPPQAAAAGAVGGVTESLLSTPFDLVRTRLLLATPLLPPVALSHPIALPRPSIRIHRPQSPSEPVRAPGNTRPSHTSPTRTSPSQTSASKSSGKASSPRHKLPRHLAQRQALSHSSRPHLPSHKRTLFSASAAAAAATDGSGIVSGSSTAATVLATHPPSTAGKCPASPATPATKALYQKHFSTLPHAPHTPPTPPTPHPTSTFSLSLARYPWTPVPSPYLPASSPWEAAMAGVRAEGAAQLWRGLRAGMTRDALFGAVFFGGWVTIEEGLRELEELRRRKREEGEEEGVGWGEGRGAVVGRSREGYGYVLTQSLEAAAAAAVASIVSHPFDCAKTRTQATVLPKHVAMELALFPKAEDGRWWERWFGLRWWDRSYHWKGLALRTMHQSIGAFLLVGGYHVAVAMTKDSSEE
ncbi:hypothetical protein CLOM_g3998 [Closterium sp. NIES-68]|nr:hypothetical protein CLOM_g3998 [Closterium sp. NIES-68]GJP76155.1 hypothetical protein CLOP_g6528 [Closterium sp. NIES-67]GJP83235.1 hypothetical protein CLOP_g13411 [Closterium sp. NIES-67]